MVRETDIPVDSLNRPEGNDLKTNYESHDVAEQAVVSLIEHHGFHVEMWGLDAREEDENLIYDDRLDIRVWESSNMDELVAMIDTKSKNSKAWDRRFNERHYQKYYDKYEEFGVPTYVVFCILDGDDVDEMSLFPMHHYDREDGYSCTFTFPDGNEGVYIPVDHVSGWELFRGECL